MKLSEVALEFFNHCWKDGKPVIINPRLKSVYVINEKQCKFTQEILEEIKNAKLVSIIEETKDYVTMGGIGERV